MARVKKAYRKKNRANLKDARVRTNVYRLIFFLEIALKIPLPYGLENIRTNVLLVKEMQGI